MNVNFGIDGPYPLWREYELWELDKTNCRLITGLEYETLRDFASFYKNPNFVGQDQNAPFWDIILNAPASSVWDFGGIFPWLRCLEGLRRIF